MELVVGDNKFRCLAPAVLGFRIFKPEFEAVPFQGHEELINNPSWQYFWTIPVYNYQTTLIECLKLHQTTIMKGIQKLAESQAWGNPELYDLIINRIGTSKNDTKYTLQSDPPMPLLEPIKIAWEAETWNPGVIFEKEGDPFKQEIPL